MEILRRRRHALEVVAEVGRQVRDDAPRSSSNGRDVMATAQADEHEEAAFRSERLANGFCTSSRDAQRRGGRRSSAITPLHLPRPPRGPASVPDSILGGRTDDALLPPAFLDREQLRQCARWLAASTSKNQLRRSVPVAVSA